MARTYAKVVGVVVLLLGIVGLFASDPLFDEINVDVIEDIVHLASGALLAYVGFKVLDEGTVRSVVGVVGVVYLLVGIIGFTGDKDLFGLLDHPYSAVDNILHLALGVLGIAAAWLMGDRGASAADR